MRQTYYLHNGAHFDGPPRRNNMANRQGLLTNPDDDPDDGPGATTSPVRDELQSAELLLEMAHIPLVTQNSQEGESFRSRL